MRNMLICNLGLVRFQLCFTLAYCDLEKVTSHYVSVLSSLNGNYNYSTSSAHVDSKILLFNVGDCKKCTV